MVDIKINDYPQLKMLLWNRPGATVIRAEEAFAVYEANWRHVDTNCFLPKEAALIDELTEEFGAGVMCV